jgi:DNA-binding CsgD family transcriptional regulator
MLVGRESEIATIECVLAEARSGRTAALVVAGEAGVGKTALLDDAVGRAEDFLVLRTRGIQAEAEVPFAALIELLGPVASQINALPDPQATALQAVFALAGPRHVEATTAAAATLALVSAAAQDAPLLVLLDDAQWLDAASGFAAALAARRLREARIAILFAVRHEEEPRFSLEGIEPLAVEPLEPHAALDLVTRTAPSLDEATAEQIVASAAGNPLALLELPSLARSGIPLLAEPLPPGEAGRRLFGRRLRALDIDERLALLAAAAERSGDLRVLTPAWASLRVAPDAIEAAEGSRLVRIEQQRLEFRHPLVRSLVYGDAAPAERRRAHWALAEALADDPRSRDERVWHLALAAVGPDAAVADALAESAARLPSAAATLERAARLTPDRAVRARRLIDAAEAAQVAGEHEAAASLAVEAQEETDDVVERARAEHAIALSELERDRPGDAVDRLDRAAASIAEVAPAQAARMLADTVDPCASSGQMARGVELTTRARDLARGSDSLTRLRVALRHADATFWAGRFGEARRLALTAAEEAAREDGAALEGIEGGVLHEAFAAGGDMARARSLVEQAVSEARRVGALGVLQWALACLFTVEFFAGRVLPALAAAEEELQLAEGLARRFTRIEALGHVAWCEAMRGLEEGCRAHIAERFELSARGRADPIVHPALGLLELLLGHGDAAVAALEPTVRIREQRGAIDAAMWTPELPMLIEAYVRAGRFADAEATLARFETQARKVERPLAEALAHRCRGMLTDEGFETDFDAALAAHELDPRPFERARTLLCYGERLRREKRRLDARERLREALDAFVALGATRWASRAEAELLATGERSRRRVASTRDELTPQELTVARLVAQGLANKEVAAQLFLSTNTIETHLRHVFQKLGLRSRTELAAKFTDFRDSTATPAS